MTDELTPEEKEAFDKLPRERMPAGLEARVVGAMRDHGFLAKRKRAIELTSGRAAGLLAACIALMVGAYSIGLHRGDGGQAPLLLEEMKRDLSERAREPESGTLEKKNEQFASPPNREAERATPEKAREAAKPASDEPRGAAGAAGRLAPESTQEQPASPAPVQSPRSDKVTEEQVRQEMAAQDALETPTKLKDSAQNEALAELGVANKSAAGTQALRATVPPSVKKQPLTFMLDGSPVVVAADSTRVVQGKHGRVLLIYTSEGIIRIPLADAP